MTFTQDMSMVLPAVIKESGWRSEDVTKLTIDGDLLIIKRIAPKIEPVKRGRPKRNERNIAAPDLKPQDQPLLLTE